MFAIIGRTNYASTFGSNTYVTFDVPATLLHTGDNVVRIKLGVFNAPATDGNNNYAAIAAKLTIFSQ